MTQTTANPPKYMPALIHFGAMTFDTIAPETALQLIADTFVVSTVAIGRVDAKSGARRLLAENSKSVKVHADWPSGEDTPNAHHIALTTDGTRDILIVQASVGTISSEQREGFNGLSPFLVAFWGARKASFEAALDHVRIEFEGSILHPDNPYKLTRAEIRICKLIADGHRPKAIAETLDTSMPTTRTHLQHIYAKTGLDGMFGVQHHLQAFSEIKGGEQ